MKHFALAVQQASDQAYGQVAMESMVEGIDQDDSSFLAEIEDQDTMLALADGLGKVAVSAESVSPTDYLTQNALRLCALEHLKVAGMSDDEAQKIFPSFESEGKSTPSKAWEKFKAFLQRLWDLIVKAAKKIYEVVDSLLKKSSVAEKMAHVQLRELRGAMHARKGALTIAPTIPLTPAHRYLFTQEGPVKNLPHLLRNIDTFRAARGKIQVELPQVLDKMLTDLMAAVDKLNVTHEDDAVVSESVMNTMPEILEAVRPMFPHYLARQLGAKNYRIPLIYDRSVVIQMDSADNYDLDTPEGAGQYIAQLGLSISQDEVPNVNLDKLPSFPALTMTEIDGLFKITTKLLEENQSTDQRRQWSRLETKSKAYASVLDGIVKVVLKRPNLKQEARTGLRVILAAMQASTKWIAAPYVQLNAVNVRVVQSLLAMARDQLKNYDVTDTMNHNPDAGGKNRQSEVEAK